MDLSPCPSIDWNDIKYVDKNKYKRTQKYLKEKDILIQSVAHSKSYIADKVSILDNIPTTIDKVLALSKFIVVRPDKSKIDPIYLYVYLSSKLGREQFKHFIRGMTAEIYEFDIQNILVLLPPKDRQQAIVKKYLENTKTFFELNQKVHEIKNSLDKIEEDLI